MKLSSPRIPPLAEGEWNDAQREFLAPIKERGQFYNVMGTMCRHFDAAERFWVWKWTRAGSLGGSRVAIAIGCPKISTRLWS